MPITVAPSVKSAKKEIDQNRKTNARRSSMSTDVTQDTDLETFDYDTSDSIEEEDDEEEVVEKRGRNSKISGRNSEGKNGDLSPNAVATAPGRKSRGSIGARQSMMSNMSTGSSLGGTLPLADSDDDTDALRGSDRLSLDSLYDKRFVIASPHSFIISSKSLHLRINIALEDIQCNFLSSNLHHFRFFLEASKFAKLNYKYLHSSDTCHVVYDYFNQIQCRQRAISSGQICKGQQERWRQQAQEPSKGKYRQKKEYGQPS
jgi:hypothetical protein